MRLGVIGGGAAGVFGAIAAAEALEGTSGKLRVSVTVLEASDQFLDKVLISGGGRCNVTHHCFEPAELVKNFPRGSRELLGAFHRFQPRDTVEWFAGRGIQLKTEADGRMFPVTDDSRTIVHCLLTAARRAGVELRLHARVKDIRHGTGDGPNGFDIVLNDGSVETFDRILLATGSSHQGHRLAADLGHTIIAPVPSLFTFKVPDPRLIGLAGLSFSDVRLSLEVGASRPFEQTGPMLITHWGLSGPAILKLSARAARELHARHYHGTLRVNFAPGLSQEDIRREFLNWRQAHGRKHLGGDNPFGLPRRYWERVVVSAGIRPDTRWSDLGRPGLNALIGEIADARFAVRGKGVFKEEFVTCGGVDLREVDFRTMESRLVTGLHFAGEILDIDGVTGGFNFQSAWTTGWIAGGHMGNPGAA